MKFGTFDDFGIGGSAGTAKDNKRIPGFDDFKSMSDTLARYSDDLRGYFAGAQTVEELDKAREELEADEQTDYPDKVVKYFYEERRRSLGPQMKSKRKEEFDDSEVKLKGKIDRTMDFVQSQKTKYRPTWN